jgi:hypothetical protein
MPNQPDRFWGPHILLFNDYWVLSRGLQRPGHKVNQIPQSSVQVKNEWIYTSTSIYTFMAWEGRTSALSFYATVVSESKS